MSGNARGKIKEHLEGIHRSFDWSLHHCNSIITIVANDKHTLTVAMTALASQIQALDDLTNDIYSTI